jgi:alcohol dehydrogenase
MYLVSRLRVAITRTALKYLKFPKPYTFIGAGSSLALCRMIADSGIKRVMVITDGQLFRLGILKAMLKNLQVAGVEVHVYSDVEPDPGHELVLRGVARLEQFRAEAVLAVGGGSSIDCAKAIVLCHANARHPAELTGVWLYALPRKTGLPLYAVPTTAGTGSEVTIAAVVSDRDTQTKKAIIDPRMTPGIVALDPQLTVGLPPFLTACTGMDALTHAIEAYISTMALPETDALSRTATNTILRSLPVACQDGHDLEARENMLLASCQAGMAFTRAGVGYVHAIAHQLGALYHVPHGLANAIVLPHVLEYSKPACAGRLADLAQLAGIGSDAMGARDRAEAFIEHIRSLNAALRIPSVVGELCEEDFETIIERAFAEAHGTYGVPRYMDRKAAYILLRKLLPQVSLGAPVVEFNQAA